ncbi:MAG: glycosyltransferase domain-containing protein [Sphingobacteriaceae bacterium]
MNKIVIYTAIFGDSETLFPQPTLTGVDFICFSDRPHATKGWQVRVVHPPFGDDHVRNNRYYKILPHLSLKEYDYSIYIDGNFMILRSPLKLLNTQMQDCHMLLFDHQQTKTDPRNCIYKEEEAIIALYRSKGVLKDDLETIRSQIDFYRSKGYPENNGLIKGGILIRKHMEPDVIQVMERWWYFIENYSKRDQLSFNYVAWENNFSFKYLPGDIRRGNPWFYMASKKDNSLFFSMLKYHWRKFLARFQ